MDAERGQPPHIVQALDTTSHLKRRLEPAVLLKKRVDPARASKDSQGLNEGILKLPAELLIYIFELVLSSNSRPILLLRRVNRFWHRLVQSTPVLWATVVIKIPSNWDSHRKCIAYCILCLQNSGDVPLNIKMDCTELKNSKPPSYRQQFAGALQTPGGYAFRKWISGITPFFTPLFILSGQDCTLMRRWRSLELVIDSLWYPDTDTQAWILRSMSQEALLNISIPQLDKIALEYVGDPQKNTGEWSGRSEWRRGSKSEISIKDLGFLRPNATLGNFPTDPTKLTRLDIAIRVSSSTLPYLYRCCNLKILRISINCEGENRPAWFPKAQIRPIHLPKLTLLQLYRNHPHGFLYSLNAPLLERIVFEEPYSLRQVNGFPMFPSLRQMDLPWKRQLAEGLHRSEVDYAREILHEILDASPLLKSFVVSTIFSAQFSRILQSYESEGMSQSSLLYQTYTVCRR